MLNYFIVIFREGMEMFLITAIAIAFLKQTNQEHLIKTAYTSVVAALLFSVGFGYGLSILGKMTPFWEGTLAFIAAGLIITCTYEIIKLGPKMGCIMRDEIIKLTGTKENVSKWGLFGFIFLMIVREGIEVSTMVAALARQTGTESMLLGCTLGLLASIFLALLWLRYGKKINLSLFFNACAIYLVLFCVQLVIYGIHEYAQINMLPFIDNQFVHSYTKIFRREFANYLALAMVLLPLSYIAIHYSNKFFKSSKQ